DEAVFPGTDDEFAAIPLPFSVHFYDSTYSDSVYVSTNGALGFNDLLIDAYSNQSIPTTGAPNAALFPYWDDMAMDSTSHLYYQTDGTAPNRVFTVTWFNWFFLSSYSDPEDPLFFQVSIYENSSGDENNIRFQYLDPYGGDLTDINGGGATIGIENATGTDGLQYSYNTASLDSGRVILFYKPIITGHNCRVNSIISPFGTHIIGSPLDVSAIVENSGTLDESTVPVSFAIVDSTDDTVYFEVDTTSLLIDEIDTIAFPDWSPISGGTYNAYCRVSVAGDTIAIDDLSTSTTTIWSHISSGGPDSLGYTWADSYDPSGPTYSTPPSDVATIVPELYGDDEHSAIVLPFTFPFYGEDYDSIWVSTNGWASFGDEPMGSYYINDSLPGGYAPEGGMLAVLWDDCDADTTFDTTASVRIYDDGSSFWIIWYNIFCPYVYSTLTGQVTFAARLFSNGIIEYHYEDAHTPESPDHDYGLSATVGIENQTGTVGLMYEFEGFPPGNPLFDHFAIRFLPPSAGPDTTGPAIVHDGATENYSDPPAFCVDLVAQISDYNAVASETLYLTEPSVMAIAADTAIGSSYHFSICDIYPGDTLWYSFAASDTLGNRSTSPEYYTTIQDPHTGGPDLIGYRFVDSWATWDTMAPTYSWIEIDPDSGGPGTRLDFGSAIVSDPISIGGNFPFYTSVASKFVICKNGWLSTDTLADAGDPYPEDSFPNSDSPNSVIAPLWTQLSFLTSGNIFYYDDTSSGEFIVQWEMFDSTSSFELLRFQAVIDYGREGSWITFNYKDIDGYVRDYSATMIEDQLGMIGLAYFYKDDPAGAYVPKSGSSVLFYNPDLTGIDDKAQLPEELAVSAYPNPFNASVAIDIVGAEKGATLNIFDIAGRMVCG
ncbi:T9SS type A sorting domain-containing protein, partial [bacterium]|nr:T9SS type A sorting domain-containing protein [bacterium]